MLQSSFQSPLNQLVREALKQSGTVEFQRARHESVLESELLVSDEKSDDAAGCGEGGVNVLKVRLNPGSKFIRDRRLGRNHRYHVRKIISKDY